MNSEKKSQHLTDRTQPYNITIHKYNTIEKFFLQILLYFGQVLYIFVLIAILCSNELLAKWNIAKPTEERLNYTKNVQALCWLSE